MRRGAGRIWITEEPCIAPVLVALPPPPAISLSNKVDYGQLGDELKNVWSRFAAATETQHLEMPPASSVRLRSGRLPLRPVTLDIKAMHAASVFRAVASSARPTLDALALWRDSLKP